MECLPAGTTLSSGEPPFDWTTKLPAKQWSGAGWAMDAIRAALTATAHVLVTRSGPALQPGPRRYTRSWIRDGTIMSAALLRMGRAEEVRDFIRWYAPHQRADGFVPCCVDGNGPDWLVEHDSHGQLIALIADYYRLTGDGQVLEESWTFVAKAVACIEGLLEPDGLLPISVSHEGYLAQPVHSFWDDFWALRGLRDAVDLAPDHWRGVMPPSAGRFWRLASHLRCFGAIERTRAEHKLDFIPGSVEWADFDPTATANAIAFLDVAEGLDRKAVERTFEMYLSDWRRKRSGALEWANYTPYEIRIIGALVRLGQPGCGARAVAILSVGSAPATVESVAGDRVARSSGASACGRPAAHLGGRGIRPRRPQSVRLRTSGGSNARAGRGPRSGVDNRLRHSGGQDADALWDVELFRAQVR